MTSDNAIAVWLQVLEEIFMMVLLFHANDDGCSEVILLAFLACAQCRAPRYVQGTEHYPSMCDFMMLKNGCGSGVTRTLKIFTNIKARTGQISRINGLVGHSEARGT
jgi:L-cysteine desulfidase